MKHNEEDSVQDVIKELREEFGEPMDDFSDLIDSLNALALSFGARLADFHVINGHLTDALPTMYDTIH